MKEKALEKNNNGLFAMLTCFFFVRTALLSPVQCFLMNPDYPYARFSAEGFAFLIFLAVCSALSAKLTFAFRNKAGDMAAVVFVIAMSDPLFFATQDNVFKLFINIVIQILVLNEINEKRIVPVKLMLPAALFLITFFVPFSILGYVPGIISIYVLVFVKSKAKKGFSSEIIIGAVCALAGFLLNRILVKNVAFFSEFFDLFGFVESNAANKRWTIVMSLLPTAVFGFIFLRLYEKTVVALSKKKSEKKSSLELITEIVFFPAIISLVSVAFTEAEGFCAINLLVPAVILTLLCLKDEACIRTMDKLQKLMKEHRIVTAVIIIAVFALAIKGVINYHSTKQLIYYIRY